MPRSMRWVAAGLLAALLAAAGLYVSLSRGWADARAAAVAIAPGDAGASGAAIPETVVPGGLLPPAGVQFDLQPGSGDAAGVAPDADFVLTASDPVGSQVVAAAISLSPPVPVAVEPVGRDGTQYRIRPRVPLAANTLYQVRLDLPAGAGRSHQWAFQTRGEFRIVATLPRDRSSGVPVSTGIEVTFSHEGYADPERFFAIAPAVPGRFERHRQTLVFVPERLDPGTIYTVTVGAGLGLPGSTAALDQAYTFAFETAAAGAPPVKRQTYFQVSYPGHFEFSLGEAPAIPVDYKSADDRPPQVQVSLFRYAGADAFLQALARTRAVPSWAAHAQSRQRESTAGLEPVADFEAPITRQEHRNRLIFPAPVPVGFYLAQLETDGSVHSVRFQVSDVSAYLAVTATDTLVWVHSQETGQPLAGVAVRTAGPDGRPLPGGHHTGLDGVARFATPAAFGEQGALPGQSHQSRQPQGRLHFVLTAPAGGSQTVLTADERNGYGGWFGSGGGEVDYWHYLYADRYLYRPGDRVHFWGLVRPRAARDTRRHGGHPPGGRQRLRRPF